MAPLGSVTIPVMDPEVLWAKLVVVNRRASRTPARKDRGI